MTARKRPARHKSRHNKRKHVSHPHMLKHQHKQKTKHIHKAHTVKHAKTRHKKHPLAKHVISKKIHIKKHPVKLVNTKTLVKHIKISKHHAKAVKHKKSQKPQDLFVRTGIKGFDDLFERGIRKGSTVLLSGGAGSGKTILGLQILANAAKRGEKGLYMSFEESEDRLREHMHDFGWDAHELEKSKALMIKKLNIFDIGRSLDALMAKSEGELLIDVKPIILPANFKPDYVVLDSLTAVASVFAGKESYRAYIENLFSYFREIGVTAFLITETEEVPTIFSPKGVDEFLADGVVVLYNIRKGDIRERAVEILKMRGTKHTGKVVAMRIDKSGIEIYPEQEVFGNM